MADLLDRLRTALGERYTIDRELGRGGMATVYLAEDVKHHRAVAIKVLRPELAAALGPERFLREIEIAAGLNHPHILPLHDSGEAGGFLYYVMPYAEGESLRDRLEREGQLPIPQALQIVRQVADALSFAHSRGLVHRDIKPENILLEHGHAVVTDFGIARAVDAARGTSLTETGIAVGTPAYMSPEQASGTGQLDGRSDVYALGCILYEMLAGEPPFTGPSAQAIIARRFTEPVPQIASRRDTVPGAMQAVLDQALARVPADRFATADELAQALQAPDLAAATPVAGARQMPVSAKSVAVLPFANLSPDPDNEYFADGMTEEIINALAQIEDLHVPARTSSFAFKGKQEDLRVIGAKLGVGVVLEGSVRKAGNRLRITAQLVNVADGYHLWSDRFDRTLDDVFAIQDEIARAIADRLRVSLGTSGDHPVVTPPTQNLRAYELYLQGRFFWNQRGPGLFKGLQCFQEALALDPAYAVAHAGLADAYSLLGFYGAMRPNDAMPRAKDAAQRALALDDGLAEAHASLGFVSMAFDWDWETAEAEFRRAIVINPKLVAARYWYAAYLALIPGRFDEAVTEARRSVELDPLAVYPRVQLGTVLYISRRFADAVAELELAVQSEPSFFLAHRLLGLALFELGRTDEAVAALQRAIDLSNRHPWAVAELCGMYGQLGRTEEAIPLYEELDSRSSTEYVQPVQLAAAAWSIDRRDAAFAWLERALDEHDVLLCVLRYWPRMDWQGFSEDPRFAKVLERVGLSK
ncbi:MAG TPA: protein kinase [Vicinamibacterales bacterium]|nr:protein kinase [Vicinamibacterales bacterium]